MEPTLADSLSFKSESMVQAVVGSVLQELVDPLGRGSICLSNVPAVYIRHTGLEPRHRDDCLF